MTGMNGMTAWPPEELHRIGAAEEIRLASRRPDGTLRPYVTMWAVRAGTCTSVPGGHAVTVRLVPQPGKE